MANLFRVTPVTGSGASIPSMRLRLRLRRGCGLVGAAVAAWCMVALPARATPTSRTAADEPQYLLTALSLGRTGSLDISDDLAAHRHRPFAGAELPVQTKPLAGGRQVSPHDPLLPVILAIPMAVGGWVAAKATLALIAGALAALTVWTAVRRFAVPLAVAVSVVTAFAVVPPLTTYGTQVYPELPAALAVSLAVAALTGPVGRRRALVVLAVAAILALPWLAVKYVPVAVALAAVLVARIAHVRDGRPSSRHLLAVGASFALGAVTFAAFHQAAYGGWTAYAAGDHFVGGELTAVGARPHYAGRSVRLLGLLVDRDFGLVAWAPAYLLMVPAGAALLRRRPPGWLALAVPLTAGWLNATFVALTMHGWWWPGRQVVVVLPLAVLAVAWWTGQVAAWSRARARTVLGAATAFGVTCWAWLLVEVARGDRTLIIDFAATANPLSRAWRVLLPDDRRLAEGDLVRYGCWLAAAVVALAYGWYTARPPRIGADEAEPVVIVRPTASRRTEDALVS